MKNRYKMPAAVYIILKNNNNEILLMRRKNTGYMDELLSFPSGHVEEGESIKSSIIREANEELGIIIKEENIKLNHIMHRKSNIDTYIDFFFTCNKWEKVIKNNEPNKCSELKWCNLENLPSDIVPYIKDVLNNKNEILTILGLS